MGPMRTTNASLAEHRNAAAYVRRSTDRQEQSLADQRRSIEDYADRHGYAIVQWYEDDAISGASVDGRAGFQQMMADARSPERDWAYVIVFDVSRFSRGDIDEAGHYRYQLRRAGVEVRYVSENLNGDDSDDLILGVKQWQARQYVKDLSKVTIRGQVSHSERGSWCGGRPPLGYDLLYHDGTGQPYQQVRWMEDGTKEVLDLDGQVTRVLAKGERFRPSKRDYAVLVLSTPERVALVQRIFRESVEEGRGYRSIAEGLNRDGIPSPTGKHWIVGTIRETLMNPSYTGDRVWNRRTYAKFFSVRGGAAYARGRLDSERLVMNDEADWIVVANAHEPIIARSTFDRAQELTKARGRNQASKSFRGGSGMRSPYLLSGLMACGRCGSKYQGRTVNSTKRRSDGSKIKTLYYACGGYVMKGPSVCRKFMLRKDGLEDIVLDHIARRLDGLQSPEGEELLREHVAVLITEQGADPRREIGRLHARMREIDSKADTLLDAMTPETAELVNGKLRDIAAENRRLQRRLDELQTLDFELIDPDAIVREGLNQLRELPRLFAHGSLEERKALVNAFVVGIVVEPRDSVVRVRMRRLPLLSGIASTDDTGTADVFVGAGALCVA